MTREEKSINRIAAALIIGLIVCIIATLNSGCVSTKKSSSDSASTTDFKKIDTAHVIKSESSSEKEAEWWRNTAFFPQPVSGDTTIVNNYNYPARPSIIIQEGGKSRESERQFNYDSLKRTIIDSTETRILKVVEQSKVKPTFWVQMIPYLLIGLVVFKLAEFLPFKITKK